MITYFLFIVNGVSFVKNAQTCCCAQWSSPGSRLWPLSLSGWPLCTMHGCPRHQEVAPWEPGQGQVVTPSARSRLSKTGSGQVYSAGLARPATGATSRSRLLPFVSVTGWQTRPAVPGQTVSTLYWLSIEIVTNSDKSEWWQWPRDLTVLVTSSRWGCWGGGEPSLSSWSLWAGQKDRVRRNTQRK